ncbi:PAS domain-containing sensor histidine kinase [Draconibacterium sp. IB214405]|uniref:sensor histidine kinase n=1 Tax=Draconibacterium sp. IB214405 TaxID=3097352 RepID=UPI002A1600BF|nr:PAS domain-containing sensor histidine kinase [Draconibacterium sp. IB214405]MDX8338447.1 PAS domain-containing sensor histidine kinase [Draconibacterium sp. IB214405]
MSTKSEYPVHKEVLDGLPVDYYVVHLRKKIILQTNNKEIEPGTACHKAFFCSEHPCDVSHGKCLFQQKLTKNQNSEFHYSYTKDNEKCYFRVRGTLLKKDLALVTLEDETAYMKKKEESERNSEKLERIAHLANFSYWEYDVKTRIFNASLAGREIYGIDKEFISFEEIQSKNLKEYRDLFEQSFADLIRKGVGFDLKYKIQRNDGAIRTLRGIATYDRSTNMVYGIVHDITGAENKYVIDIEYQEYLSMLFKKMSSAFAQHKIETDENGQVGDIVIMDVNPSYENLFGVRREDVVGESFRKVFPQISDRWIQYMGKKALSGEAKLFKEYVPWLKKHVEIYAYSPGKGYYVATINDVTDRIQSEIELKKAKQQAVEGDRLKTHFLTNMSHEIRTPLNGILGFSSLLSQGGLTEENRMYYGQIIEKSGKRLMKIIDDIIDVSMIQSGQIKIDKRPIDINELLREVYTMYSKGNADKLKRIKFEMLPVESTDDRIMYSDKEWIYQALNNLLDNAFKFTERGKIAFGVEKSDLNEVIFFVKDSGIGIKEEKQSYIFDLFRQVEEGQSRSYEGFGLGLAIVNGIVKKLNGKIKLQSQHKTGSEFTIVLPRNHEQVLVKKVAGHESSSA